MSIFPKEMTAPGSASRSRIEPRLNQVFQEADSLKGMSIFLIVSAALAVFGVFIGGALLIGYGVYLLRQNKAAFFKIAASSLIGLGVVGLLIRLVPHPGVLGLYLLLAFGLSLYMVLHAHRMIGFLEVTGREDPSWGQIRKKAVLSRVLCAISAGLLLLALLMVVAVIVLQAFRGAVAIPN